MSPCRKYRAAAFCLFSVLGSVSFHGVAQAVFRGYEHLLTTPKNYVARYTAVAPVIDGDLSDPAWAGARWTADFEDIEGDRQPKPGHRTRVKMVWNDSCLYLAAELEDPHVWASLRQRDAIIYHDNDFEVFLDPTNDTHQYFEMEVNALNTLLDLFLSKPYRNGGQALLTYNANGLQSAVTVNGTVNEPADQDRGWTVEMAIPFQAVQVGNHWRSPEEGALWRVNFSRVQWDTDIVEGRYVKKTNGEGRPLPERNWVWSPQGVVNMHFPERWGYLQFTKEPTGETAFVLPEEERWKPYLWLLYYKQKEQKAKNKTYAASLQALGLRERVRLGGVEGQLKMEATTRQFSATITFRQTTVTINDEGLVQTIKPNK